MPSSSEVRARQPSLARRLTSSNLRGVPSGFEVSKLISPGISDDRGDHAREFGDGDVLAGADVDVFVVAVVLHQMDAGVGEVVDVEEFAARRAGAPDHDVADGRKCLASWNLRISAGERRGCS